MMNTCGQCRSAKPKKDDLRMRDCMFGPPQAVVLPQGLAMIRPIVAAASEAPHGCFKPGVYGKEEEAVGACPECGFLPSASAPHAKGCSKAGEWGHNFLNVPPLTSPANDPT